MNLFKDKVYTNINTLTPLVSVGKSSAERPTEWNSGFCFSSVALLLLSLLCPWISAYKHNDYHSIPSLLSRFSAMWFISFPSTQDGKKTWWYFHDSRKIVGWHGCSISNSACNGMLWTVMLLLCSSYKVPRRLLWRRQHWLESKSCGEVPAILELFDYTQYEFLCVAFFM